MFMATSRPNTTHHIIVVDGLADLDDFVFGQIAHAAIFGDPDLFADVLRIHGPMP